MIEQTADGSPILSATPSFIIYRDTQSDRSVVLAEQRSGVELAVKGNVATYSNAFSGLRANLRYTVDPAQVEQDVLLFEKPLPPSSYGLNNDTTRFVVLTRLFHISEHFKEGAQTVTGAGAVQGWAPRSPEGILPSGGQIKIHREVVATTNSNLEILETVPTTEPVDFMRNGKIVQRFARSYAMDGKEKHPVDKRIVTIQGMHFLAEEVPAKLILESGLYNINNIVLEENAQLLANGPVDIRVAGAVDASATGTVIGPNFGANVRANGILIYSALDPVLDPLVPAINFGPAAYALGTFYAKYGTIELGPQANAQGLLIAKDVKMEFGAGMTSNVGAPPQIQAPEISPNGGDIIANTLITLSTPTPGVDIFYTTDGTDPATIAGGSTLAYTDPFSLPTSASPQTVKAIAVRQFWQDSSISTASFNVDPSLPPTINITSPQDGKLVIVNQPEIEITYTDDNGVNTSSLALQVNGQPLQATCDASEIFATCMLDEDLPEGNVTLTTTIADIDAQSANDSVTG